LKEKVLDLDLEGGKNKNGNMLKRLDKAKKGMR
jgi:hypothetical protein